MNPRAAINDLLPFQGSPFGQLGYFSKSGEGGIRTHAPFRTNGFQDRLVMTTSIPLQLFICLPLPYHLSDKMYSIIAFCCRQYFFLTFLFFCIFLIFLYFLYINTVLCKDLFTDSGQLFICSINPFAVSRSSGVVILILQ